MKNTKMKYKIFFLMVLLVISLNNVSAVSYVNGSLQVEGYAESDTTTNEHFSSHAISTLVHSMEFHYASEALSGVPSRIMYENIRMSYIGDYANLTETTGGPFQLYDGETAVGTGSLFITKKIDRGSSIASVKLQFYFDDVSFISGTNKIYTMKVYTHTIKNYYSHLGYAKEIGTAHPEEYSALDIGISPFLYNTLGSNYRTSFGDSSQSTLITYRRISDFRNDYSIKLDSLITTTDINRNFPDNTVSSEYMVRNEDSSLFYQSGYTTSNSTHNEITNNTQKYYIKPQASGIEHLIYSYTPPPTPEYPTLITDKSLYNTSELLTISYTNIDEMDIHRIPALFIVYPIIDDYHDYDAKFMQHLLSSKEDETFTINTSILHPQTEYYLVIADNTDWSRIESAYITSDVFYVYPDEEYLTTSCTPEGNCYTGNGDYISIYYKINNNSDIIVKDDEGDIIQTYYNIINEGEINFQIPFDENKLNSYPNWKIYLNNTGYETNYSTDVAVYWSLFVEPTPTPVYTIDIPDENVSEMVDDLKKESKPIFDLIYGLTTLVIDNPDYDNDNIIDEHEINNWFNSLIPLGILLLLIILYMGLKKRD